MNLTKTLVVIVVLFVLPTSVLSQSTKLKIGIIDNTNENTCGINLTFANSPEGKEVFVSNEDGSRIRIDGKIINFNLSKSTENNYRKPKKGDKFTETYLAKGFKLVINYTITGFEDDAVHYKTVLTVTKGKSTAKVNLVGWGGC